MTCNGRTGSLQCSSRGLLLPRGLTSTQSFLFAACCCPSLGSSAPKLAIMISAKLNEETAEVRLNSKCSTAILLKCGCGRVELKLKHGRLHGRCKSGLLDDFGGKIGGN